MGCVHLPAADYDPLAFEREAIASGFVRIAGVDEVGRGPLAGPVVAAAVVFSSFDEIPVGLGDSKCLTEQRREELAALLHASPSVTIGIGIVPPEAIDRLNILKATHLAMREALAKLNPPCDFALVDGLPVYGLPVLSKAIVKGDKLSASISAASIVAKVYRDRLMSEYDRQYPGYGFAEHKGYATKLHLKALDQQGPCSIHRRSFAPVSLFFTEYVQLGLPFEVESTIE